MDLSELTKLAADQDAGHTFELFNPENGAPVGIKVTVAGPDSERTRKAYFHMQREITRLSARKNGLTPEKREELSADFLFAVTMGWEVKEGGKELPFTKENFARLMKAGAWVRAQIDTFAGDRAPYFEKGE